MLGIEGWKNIVVDGNWWRSIVEIVKC